MWSLGKVLGTPEVARVYIGSFWDQPLRYNLFLKQKDTICNLQFVVLMITEDYLRQKNKICLQIFSHFPEQLFLGAKASNDKSWLFCFSFQEIE